MSKISKRIIPTKPVKLTIRQKIFVKKYLETFNATLAAKYAGYSVKTAHAIGHSLLSYPSVHDEISKRLKAMNLDELITNQEIIAGFIKIAEDPKASNSDKLKSLELLSKYRKLFDDTNTDKEIKITINFPEGPNK